MRQFFAYLLFKYLKKDTYESENTWDNFLLMPFFKYLKKHTYESEYTWDNFLLIPFSNITNLKNTSFYTNNNLHKNHYINR